MNIIDAIFVYICHNISHYAYSKQNKRKRKESDIGRTASPTLSQCVDGTAGEENDARIEICPMKLIDRSE